MKSAGKTSVRPKRVSEHEIEVWFLVSGFWCQEKKDKSISRG